MKREFSMLMKDLEGCKRVTRSHNKSSSSKSVEEHIYRIKDEVVMDESMRTVKDVNIANLLDNSCNESSGSLNADSPAQVGTGGHPNVEKCSRFREKPMWREVSRKANKEGFGNAQKSIDERRAFRWCIIALCFAALHYGAAIEQKRLEGFKKDGGIFCTCCDTVAKEFFDVSASQFEAHAG